MIFQLQCFTIIIILFILKFIKILINIKHIMYIGDSMSIIKFNTKEKELLARIMRSEALGEGNLGMLMVGNVVVNRVLANCLSFVPLITITDVLYQENQFTGVNSPLFFSNPTTKELNLATRILRGEYYYPATNSLWFYAPATNEACQAIWYEQFLSGRYKNHCFYNPDPGICPTLR